jgi:hypothetical protein
MECPLKRSVAPQFDLLGKSQSRAATRAEPSTFAITNRMKLRVRAEGSSQLRMCAKKATRIAIPPGLAVVLYTLLQEEFQCRNF